MEHLIERLLRDFEHGKMTRRQLVRGLAVAAAAPSSMAYAMAPPAETLAATGVNHISYGVADYARTRDFYVNLLGVQVRGDNGSQCQLVLGDSFILARKSQQPDTKPYVDHFAIT